MKCTECNGTGEREMNIDGADCPVVCGFCEGTGVEDEASQKLIIALKEKLDAVSLSFRVLKYDVKDYPKTQTILKAISADYENQIEEIRNRE